MALPSALVPIFQIPQIKPPLPFVLGTEFAGVVSKEAVIPNGCAFKQGGQSAVGCLRSRSRHLTNCVRSPVNDWTTSRQGVWSCTGYVRSVRPVQTKAKNGKRPARLCVLTMPVHSILFLSPAGAYAEQVAVDYRQLLPIPDTISFDQAGAYPLVLDGDRVTLGRSRPADGSLPRSWLRHVSTAGMSITWPTSYEGIVGRGQAKKGEFVLVHAGAGGVGQSPLTQLLPRHSLARLPLPPCSLHSYPLLSLPRSCRAGLPAIQIAVSLGCRVIATARGQTKLDVCRNQGGAEFAVDYSKEGWQQEVMKITGGKGVDVVFDPVVSPSDLSRARRTR